MTTATLSSAPETLTRVETMKAVVADAYGGPEVLRLGEVPRPDCGEAEVLVRVHSAGLDRGAVHLMTGKPYLMRLFGFGFSKLKNPVMGLELSGTVIAVGAQVTRFKVGDEVFGIGMGTFAEVARAREDKLAHKPPSLSFEQASVVAISGLTALKALCEVGEVKAGQRVLVIGASGGVGTYLVQLARAFGAHVTAVCSAAKADFVRTLGANQVFDYQRDDFAAQRYDLILDCGGHSPLSKLARALAPKGTVVFVGSEQGGNITGGIFLRPLLGALRGLITGQRFKMLLNTEHFAGLLVLSELFESGKVTPAVDRVNALGQVPEAMRALMAGEVKGKIAVRVGA